MFSKKIILGLTMCLASLAAFPAQAQNSGQLFFCENESRTWTLYESSQPRMFHQEISVQGPGTFTLSMRANGFGYEGFSYTRRSAWDKWKYVMKTNKGKRNWQQTWRVFGDEQRLGLLQLIKDSNACKNCTITMKMTATNCKKKPDKPRGSGQQCAVNQCWNGSVGGVFGVGQTCDPYPGWNGGKCPY